jgi:hypothetical protein
MINTITTTNLVLFYVEKAGLFNLNANAMFKRVYL